jgi:hypothetical protein
MKRCAAVRKRGSSDQCLARSMKGLTFCGRHARTRAPVLWVSLHETPPVVRFQALVRGWLVRHRLSLAGPGVLRRKAATNDEDLFTCETKDRHHPLQYFSFEEAGKVWWFDVESLWGWISRSVEPVNPYTKILIPTEARKRLREIQRRGRLSFGATTVEEMNVRRWNVLAQVFRENGFTEAHPMQFANFDLSDYRAMFVFLERDLQTVLPESSLYRKRLLRMCRQGQRGDELDGIPVGKVFLLLRMVSIPKDPYVLVFSILASFTRC